MLVAVRGDAFLFTSLLYFRAYWHKPFPASDTHQSDFTLLSGNPGTDGTFRGNLGTDGTFGSFFALCPSSCPFFGSSLIAHPFFGR